MTATAHPDPAVRLRAATDAALQHAQAGTTSTTAVESIRVRFTLTDDEVVSVAHRVEGALLRLAFAGKAGA